MIALKYFYLIIIVINRSFSNEFSGNNKKLNVLFIILDDFRPAIYSLGDKNAVTPNLDKLIDDSFVFTNAYAQQALCAPSRNSMLTSRRPDTLHLYDFYSYWRRFAGNFTTLPQYLKEFGYHTYSIGKIFHPGVSSNFSDDYPLSWSEPAYHPSTEKYMNEAVCIEKETGKLVENLICPVSLELQPENTLPDLQSIEKAKEKLKEFNSQTNPFFLSVGLHKPHIPFRIPFKYFNYHPIEKFQNNDFLKRPYGIPIVAFNPYMDIRSRDDVQKLNLTFPFGPMDYEFGVKIRQSYYSAVTYVDDLIGELLKEVNLNETVVIVTGDHGWSLGEHSMWAKYSNFDVTLKVPLIFRLPNQLNFEKVQKLEQIVELIDLFPTIVDILKLPSIPKCFRRHKSKLCTEGKSLYPFKKTTNLKKFTAFSQYPRPSDYPKIFPDFDKPRLAQIKIMGYTIRTEQFRYTIWIKFNHKIFRKNWKKIYAQELYDHTIDPKEMINLTSRNEFKLIIKNLKKILINKFK